MWIFLTVCQGKVKESSQSFDLPTGYDTCSSNDAAGIVLVDNNLENCLVDYNSESLLDVALLNGFRKIQLY